MFLRGEECLSGEMSVSEGNVSKGKECQVCTTKYKYLPGAGMPISRCTLLSMLADVSGQIKFTETS